MKLKLITTLKSHWSKILSVFIFIILLGAYANIFAIGSPYSPGSTLNPECAPGEENCRVDTFQVEEDPTVSTYVKGITDSYFTNGNTAHSWGDHSLVGYITGVSSSDITTALGYTPYNSTNPSNYISDAPSDSLLYARRNGAWTTFTVPTTYTWSYTVKDDGWINLVDNGKIVHFNSDDDSLDITTSLSSGHWYINSEVADDGHSHTSSSISGLSVSDFTSPNISNWTNNANYITDGNTNWDNSYGFITDGNTGWDNSYGFLTSYTETDPVFSAYTFSGSGTQLALTNSPVFTTPSLGVATATSINNLPISQNNTDFNVKVGQDAGLNLVAGAQYNTFLGYEAGQSSSGGSNHQADYNTAVGYQSLYSNTSGNQNTANGYHSLYSNTTGYYNTANGYLSLSLNTTGSNNTATGLQSLIRNTTGNRNTANGSQSLMYNTTGYYNTANGYGSLRFNTTGNLNTANGHESLNNNTTGSYNIAIGSAAGYSISGNSANNTTSDYSIYIGPNTKPLADDDQNEIVIGYNATGNGSNTATIGNSSLLRTYLTGVNLKAGTATAGTAPLKLSAGTNLTTTEAGAIEYDGTHLYFTATDGGTRYQLDQQGGLTVGTTAITSGTSGRVLYNNSGVLGEMTTSGTGTVIALATSPSFTTPSLGVATATSINNLPLSQNNTDFNVKVGQDAGFNLVTGAQSNTFLGYEAGLSSSTLSTDDADYNTAVGYRSLYSNTTGNGNTANGTASLYFNTTGYSNTANGYGSLFFNTTGFNNTANGSQSLSFNTTGSNNTANGAGSLQSNTTGSENVANGSHSLYSNTTGSENVANGISSLRSNTTGNQNTASGNESLVDNTTGSWNTANGSRSLYYNTTGSNNTASGYESLYSIGRTYSAGALITGVSYTIISTGTTDFTICGASNSTPGTVFTHNGTPCTGMGEASSNSNNNVAEGYYAGRFIANGSTALTASLNSLFLGADTKALQDGSNNEIVLGYNATGHGSNTATWGSTAITNHYFSGNVQYTSYGAGTLTTDANGNITASSDERLKNIIGYYDNKIDNTDSDTNNTETDEDTNNTDDTNTNNDIDSVITEKQKSALERIMEINPIIYKWNEKSGLETEHEYVGFSAQNLQLAIPEAVGLDKRVDPETGENYLTISDRPILATVVNAIKEMNLKVESFEDFEAEENTLRDNLGAWLANATNKITRIFTGEICLTDGSEEGPVCLNASELRELKESLSTQADSDSDEPNDNQTPPTETCSDGIMNQDETGLDEGGVCIEHEVVPTCTDGILNQDETEVDTGGICTPPADPKEPEAGTV